MLSHVSGVIGYGALVLYTLGVVKSLGQLRASEIGQLEGLPLIPLDRHLRNGLGILLQPGTFAIVMTFAVMLVVTVAMGAWIQKMLSTYEDLAERFVAESPDFALIMGIWFLVVAFFGGGYSLLASEPWTESLYPAALIITSGLSIAGLVWIHKARWQLRFGVVLVGLAAGFVSAAGIIAYYASDPLPDARIKTKTGAKVVGRVVATSDGVVFVGVDGKPRQHKEIPLAHVVSMTVTHVKGPKRRSVLELIGVK